MTLENYCKKCGHRILPNNQYCPECGCKTFNTEKEESYVFTPPIHNIGFFNFSIDFSLNSFLSLSKYPLLTMLLLIL